MINDGVVRNYSINDVIRLRGPVSIDYTFAKNGCERFRQQLNSGKHVSALGALTGNQAVQAVSAGLNAIYISGWQIAADANTSGHTYPDMSLYPVNSVSTLVKRINNALLKAGKIEFAESGSTAIDWMVPIIADAEAGFGGILNVYELILSLIEAGAAAVHLEDQVSSGKRCGHLGGKCLIPTTQFIDSLVAARLATDVCNIQTILIARTDAESAVTITSDIDENDRCFIDFKAGRTREGFFKLTGSGIERCIARGLSYAPYSDMLWMETSTPNLDQAEQFAQAIHGKFPQKWLCYNLSPSFSWSKNLSKNKIREFVDKLAEFGFVYTFITLAGWHVNSKSMFELASNFMHEKMLAYATFQDSELELQSSGYSAVKHQRESGVGYYDTIQQIITRSNHGTALVESTESKQFK